MALALYRRHAGIRACQAGVVTVLFAMAPDDDISVQAARDWIKRHGITGDDARLIKKDGVVQVIDKGTAFAKLKGPE